MDATSPRWQQVTPSQHAWEEDALVQDRETGIPMRERMEALGLGDEGARLHDEGPYPEWTGPVLWPLDAYPHGGQRS